MPVPAKASAQTERAGENGNPPAAVMFCPPPGSSGRGASNAGLDAVVDAAPGGTFRFTPES